MPDSIESLIGPAAGLATSLLWTGTSLFFTAAGKRLGATTVNAARLALAIALHVATLHLLSGYWFPDLHDRQIVYLALSGLIGLSIGDQVLLIAFIHIGPRLSMLMMTTSPLFAALFGFLALGETLPPVAWVGMAMTITGVAWVVLERQPTATADRTPYRLTGIMLAVVAAACQAGGLLLSKQGMGHGWLPAADHLPPQSATTVRMIFGGLGMIPLLAARHYTLRRRRYDATQAAPRLRATGWLFAAAGAVVGPYLGVWMSLVASDRTPLGVAQTLCSLAPVFILPFVVLIYKERITLRATIGAVIAVTGSALLFIEPN